MRAFIRLRRDLGTIDGDFSDILDQHEDIAKKAWEFAYKDELRKQYRRSSITRITPESALFLDVNELNPCQEDHDFDAVEEQLASFAEIKHLYENGTPHQQRAIVLMVQIMRQILAGKSGCQPRVRKELSKLRRITGWKLDVNLLYAYLGR